MVMIKATARVGVNRSFNIPLSHCLSTVDDVAPVIVCVEDITQTTPLGTGGITVSWVEPTATDNSGSVSLSSRSHAPGSFFSTGSTQVTYVFEDPSGNSGVCAFFVTVNEGKD